MLVSGKEILDKAHKGNYAVGAFNFSNMELLDAIIQAAEEENAPVIIQTSEGAISYASHEYLYSMAKAAAEKAKIPVALNLDHGTTYETIMKCIAGGWTSVMIDGSHYDLEENIEVTKEIIKVAHACGVSVEAELGRLSGVEDQISVSAKDAYHTDPQEAKRFVEETGVDYLAIAIGTAHGKYKGDPKLDFDRLDEIKKLVNIPVVLHGSSGVSEESIRKAVSLGVNKINIDTDLRIAFKDAIKDVIDNKPDVFDPRALLNPARAAVKEVVKEKIRMFGSTNKA